MLEAWAGIRAVGMADLAMPTVAAFAPADWAVRLCDERVEPVDFDASAEFIGLTGKITQRERLRELATEFQRRGRKIIIGGSYASLSPEEVRTYADILVIGEIEEIAAELFADLSSGRYKPEYRGTKPDIGAGPLPRWDLYPPGHAMTAQVQTSRGCPFECEFCDVIQYLGRKQRWKEPERVIEELNLLHGYGYRSVFFADDNLTVMRRRTRSLLEALACWNDRPAGDRMAFSTQVSIDIARDADILNLLRESGFAMTFIGIETPNEESLSLAGKRQNLNADMIGRIRTIAEHGILAFGGIVVGFDQDGPDIFERQAAFIQAMPLPLVSPGLLVAPDATPLHARLAAAGRLIDGRQSAASVVGTNIRPLLMSDETLRNGMIWLLNRVFSAELFAERVAAFVDICGEHRPQERMPFFSGMNAALARRLARSGRPEYALIRMLDKAAHARPDLLSILTTIFVYYCQARFMLEREGIWDETTRRRDRPLI
ncbi:B12-binding domain-containing radical SAM protein (plasmid) [Shinella sp. H4-D48]|uniref:radical SAM protein n=1 Tax=Shinella sp. H4-D48 TaxID=2925841 RepID=UPI001F5395F1|nr:radical SAM protein [Shinella sp. H4-D48]UNK39978.1 B12-binding domain-containing radical SAM protein [Shinella sp. H4-D48]